MESEDKVNILQKIFQECHGAISPKNFKLVKDCDDSLFNDYILSLSKDPFLRDNLYYNENGLMSCFFYYKDFLFIEGTVFLFHKDNYKQYIETENKNYQDLLSVRDWPFIFLRMEKKISMYKYIEMFDSIPDELKYDSFVNMYVRNEYGFESLSENDFIYKVFSYAHLSKEREERLNNLKKIINYKKKFRVYHGSNLDFNPHDNYSWTLKKETAEFFAYRFNAQGSVFQRTISIDDVIDFINYRNEYEILIRK